LEFATGNHYFWPHFCTPDRGSAARLRLFEVRIPLADVDPAVQHAFSVAQRNPKVKDLARSKRLCTAGAQRNMIYKITIFQKQERRAWWTKMKARHHGALAVVNRGGRRVPTIHY